MDQREDRAQAAQAATADRATDIQQVVMADLAVREEATDQAALREDRDTAAQGGTVVQAATADLLQYLKRITRKKIKTRSSI